MNTPVEYEKSERWLCLAQETLSIEVRAIENLKNRLVGDVAFIRAINALLQVTGRIVVMGMGKSGHIGRKIAATFASTGSPAFFVHPAEAGHGDLGMITKHDLVLAISNSGESQEMVFLLPLIKRLGATLVVMSGIASSSMAQQADIFLSTHVEKEACPLNLAPTASTVVQLALGDALAMCLLDAKGFQSEDFARSHPGGTLGRRLLTRVSDVMRSGKEIPMVTMDASLGELISEMGKKGVGAAAVVNSSHQINQVMGIFTDGDLRRLIELGKDLGQQRASAIMRKNPITIGLHALAVDAAVLMEANRINCILVVNETDGLIGVVSSNDLMRAKVI